MFPSSRIVSKRSPASRALLRVSQPRVGEPPLSRNLDSERRHVDSDYLVAAALKVQADAPCAAAE